MHYTNVGRRHSLRRGLFARPTESERNVTLFVVALDASLRCFEAVRDLAFSLRFHSSRIMFSSVGLSGSSQLLDVERCADATGLRFALHCWSVLVR